MEIRETRTLKVCTYALNGSGKRRVGGLYVDLQKHGW